MTTKNLIIVLLAVGLYACGSGNNTSQQNHSGNFDEFTEDPDGYAYTQLGLACRDGDLNKVKALIEEGANKSRCMANEIPVRPTNIISQVQLLAIGWNIMWSCR